MGNLKSALEIVYSNEINSLPSEAELESQITISPQFEQRIKRDFLESELRMPNRRAKRMLLVAVIAALIASVMSVQAIREPIISFVLEVYKECTDFLFDSADRQFTENDGFFIPDSPEGYTEINREEVESFVEVEYSTEDGRFLRYTQYRHNNATLSVDTENAKTDMKRILGYDVFVYSNKGYNSMIWNDDVFAYKLNSTADISELQNIAEKIIEKIK